MCHKSSRQSECPMKDRTSSSHVRQRFLFVRLPPRAMLARTVGGACVQTKKAAFDRFQYIDYSRIVFLPTEVVPSTMNASIHRSEIPSYLSHSSSVDVRHVLLGTRRGRGFAPSSPLNPASWVQCGSPHLAPRYE